MKLNYTAPYISVEDLEKADILLASGETPTPTPPEKEKENVYKDISEFILSGNWFD